jgi:hypothetical protein
MQVTSVSACFSHSSFYLSRPTVNCVDLLPHSVVLGGLQIPHRAFHVRVSQPLLNCSQVNPSPQTPSRESRPELVQPEVVLVEFRTFCDCLQIVDATGEYIGGCGLPSRQRC